MAKIRGEVKRKFGGQIDCNKRPTSGSGGAADRLRPALALPLERATVRRPLKA